MSLVTCTLSNTGDPIYLSSGGLASNTLVTFNLVRLSDKLPTSVQDAVSGEFIGALEITATTDAFGVFSVALWPNDRGDEPTCWKVSIRGAVFKPFFVKVSGATITLAQAKAAMSTATPQDLTPFQTVLAEIQAANEQYLALLGGWAQRDIRAYMDGQSERPTVARWTADQALFRTWMAAGATPDTAQVADLTSTFQAAVDATHGAFGGFDLPVGVFTLLGKVYVQTSSDMAGATGLCWTPFELRGEGRYCAPTSGRGGAGATIIYTPTAQGGFRVNLNANGVGMTTKKRSDDSAVNGAVLGANTGKLGVVYRNFSVRNIAFLGETGVQVTPLKGYATQATLSNLSFINVWRGWDFHDQDVNGAENYSDLWNVDDIYFTGIGDHMFRQASADSSIFKNLKCEGFQSTAVGAFKLWGGRGWRLLGVLINGLPSTSAYVGHLYFCSEGAIEQCHFEQNYCSTPQAGSGTANDPGTGGGAAHFLVASCNSVKINGNKFFDTQAAQTKPYIYFTGGTGNEACCNEITGDRSTSYDIVVYSNKTLTWGNHCYTYDSGTGLDTPRAELFYRDASVEASCALSALFEHHPITIPQASVTGLKTTDNVTFASVSTSSANANIFTRSVTGSQTTPQSVIQVGTSDSTGVGVGGGAAILLFSSNSAQVKSYGCRYAEVWENPTAGQETCGGGVYVRPNSADTTATTLAVRFRANGDMEVVAGNVKVSGGDIVAATAGKGLKVKEGTNAMMGAATLSAGAIAITHTTITNAHRVFLTHKTISGTPGFLSVVIVDGTGFTIHSTSNTDTSSVQYLIVGQG